MAGYFLKGHVTRAWDDYLMPLLLFTGPLVNTASPTSGRMCIMSRSPLTGTVGDSSVGGSFGTSLKKAGWDGLIITGRSDCLCGIEITDSHWVIRDADHLKGAMTDMVHEECESKGSVLCVGPAAENGIRFSSIMVDRHFAAGRNGLGLVCAGKNLKYITVKGSANTPVHNKTELKAAREQIYRLAAASPVLMGEAGISNRGTGALYDLMDSRCMMPTENFQRTRFSDAARMNAHAYQKKFRPKKDGCKGCHILCKKRGANGEVIPEFETMSHFSALLVNTDIDSIIQANRICNSMGMDTISAAATLACFSEITGNRLTPDRIISLLEDIGLSKGEGRELGKGSAAFADDTGCNSASMSVKAQEIPAYDPRGAYGMALAYAISTRGACHLRAYPISHEILRKPVSTDRFSFQGKARIIKIAEDMNAVVDSLTVCKFLFLAASLEEFAKAYTAVTGIETSAQELIRAGERTVYQERIMNALNGFCAAHDDLPERFFESGGTSGAGFDVPGLNREDFLQARARYYRIRGLDSNGIPLQHKAAELGLEWKS